RRGRPPREHANRGSGTVKHGGARRPPGRRRTSATYFSFSRSSFPSFSESACLPSLWSLWTSATLALASAAAGSKRFAVAALIWAMSFGHWLASAWPAAKTTARATATSVRDPRMVPSGEVHEDRAALDVDGIAGLLDRGVVDVGAGRDVPAPSVPGAGHHAPVELALAERPAPVGARVVDR